MKRAACSRWRPTRGCRERTSPEAFLGSLRLLPVVTTLRRPLATACALCGYNGPTSSSLHPRGLSRCARRTIGASSLQPSSLVRSPVNPLVAACPAFSTKKLAFPEDEGRALCWSFPADSQAGTTTPPGFSAESARMVFLNAVLFPDLPALPLWQDMILRSATGAPAGCDLDRAGFPPLGCAGNDLSRLDLGQGQEW
jgi:hypothetical protein